MKCPVLLQHTLCHCELDDSPTRQSIVSCTLPGAQWIATGYALAMTRCEVMQCAVRLQHALVIARKERSEGRGNLSWFRGCEQMMELAYLLTLICRALQALWLYKLTLQQIANNLFGQPFIDLTMTGHWLG